MSTPKRIQRQRTKGWRMPGNATYVGRPTKWGNPFWPELFGGDLALALYRDLIDGWTPSRLDGWPHEEVSKIYAAYCAWNRRLILSTDAAGVPADRIKAALRGRDLACWCRLDHPCHADILLEVANR